MRRVLLTLLLASATLFAKDRSLLDQCMDKADTQLAIHLCADEEAKRVEAKLNTVYRQVLAAAREEPGAVEKIRASERAWIVYRDTYLDAMFPADDKLANYGSL